MTSLKTRIDHLLVARGLASSRAKAQAMIMAGVVIAGDRRVEKPSESFTDQTAIRIKGSADALRYVGRGGLKLEAALRDFEIDVTGLTCIDIGSSTGGFTDCLLQHGAVHVTAVDAGTNQLDWRLRQDARVSVHEKTNARHLTVESFGRTFDLMVMDVSFISVTKLLSMAARLLSPDGRLIVLIKPQFEVGKVDVGKGGIVRDPQLHRRVIDDVERSAADHGLVRAGLIESPILGAEGNKEFLALYEKVKTR